MKRISPWKTVRSRLVFLAVGLEALMLTVMIINSIRLLHGAMSNQIQGEAQQFSPVLIAALTAPLAARDYATMQAVVDESRTKGGLDYIVVVDRYGHRLAANGWPEDMPMHEPSTKFSLFGDNKDLRYHVVVPIEFQRQPLGQLHFGINLSKMAHARQELLMQGVGIAAIEILLSSVVLLCLGFWLTRHMKSLTQASLEVASGNLSPPPVPEGDDDVGKLGAAFNIMSRVIKERVNELTVAKETAEVSALQLRSITHSANDAILMMDPQGAISYWNPAAEKILGYRPEEAIGRNLHQLLAPQHYTGAPEAALAEFRRTGRGNVIGKTLELFAKRKDGQEIPVALSLSSVFFYGAWHAVGILHDITERKQHEHELEKAREEAEEANLAKSEFLANMSHEIRTPMNAILGMAYLTLQGDLTAKQKEQITHLHNAAESLLGILNEILDFSKVEAGKMTLETAPFVLKDSIQQVVDLLKPKLQEKRLEFRYEQQDGVLLPDAPLLLGDELRLRQILINLLSNATKFTQIGFVRFGITSVTAGNFIRVIFTIADSGIGMNSKQISQLFKKFTQADASTTRKYGGTGLGLAIAGKLVTLMGGKIDVQSQIETGTCFTVEIPFEIARTKEIPLRKPRAPETFAPLQGLRILLVEDNPVNRRVAVNALEMIGMLPDTTENGEQAVKTLQSLPSETYKAVLMDLEMPVMDGYEAAQRIRADRRFDSLPIIALSTRVMDFEKERCNQVGMNACINVPFDPNDLWNSLLHMIVNNTLTVSNAQPVQPDRSTDSASTIQGLNFDELDSADGAKAIGGRQNDVATEVWIETLIDHLCKGDFNAVELWEKHKTMMTDRLSPADLELIDRALQQFDFTRALECLEAHRENR